MNSLFWELTPTVKVVHTTSFGTSCRHPASRKFPPKKIKLLDPRHLSRDFRCLTIPSTSSIDNPSSEPIKTDSVTVETPLPDKNPALPSVQPAVNGKASSSQLKKSPLTAREKLRAARLLSRYNDPKTAKTSLGSKVLDALRESDGSKKRSRLPQAPTNLLDDSKRGMPKQGLTFDFPGGADLFFIALSFVLISTVMFTTTYVVWKLGAIHFNEY